MVIAKAKTKQRLISHTWPLLLRTPNLIVLPILKVVPATNARAWSLSGGLIDALSSGSIGAFIPILFPWINGGGPNPLNFGGVVVVTVAEVGNRRMAEIAPTQNTTPYAQS